MGETSVNDDLRANLSMRPVDRAVIWILGIMVLGLLLLMAFVVRPGIEELDDDDALIDRQGKITNCIGDRQDAIDKWRAVVTFEFVRQVERSSEGLPVDTSGAKLAEVAIYELVDDKQAIRDTQLDLIADDDPNASFICPDIPEMLVPPPLPAES